MRTLKFSVNGQELKKNGDFSGIQKGSKGYLKCFFVFGADWSGTVQVAEFKAYDNNEVFSVAVRKGECLVPDEITNARKWNVRLVGKKGDTLIPTNFVFVKQEG